MRFADRSKHPGFAIAGTVVLTALLTACASPDGRLDAARSGASDAAATTAGSNAKAPSTAPAADPKRAPSSVSPDTQRAYDAAVQALAAGRTAEAERAFAALARSNPDLAGPHANLGMLHRQAGRTSEAVAELEKAVALNPDRADLHNQLGVAYRSAGEFAKAKASYERSIALDANYAPALVNLGILYDLYLWDGARALELYDRYMQLAPGDEQVKRWVTDLRNRAAPKNAVARKEQG